MKNLLGTQRSYHFNYLMRFASKMGLRAQQNFLADRVCCRENTIEVNFRVIGRNAAFVSTIKVGHMAFML